MFERLKKKLRSFTSTVTKTIEEKIVEKGKAAISGETILDEKDVNAPLEELELALLESDTALSVVEELIPRVKANLIGKKINRGANTEEIVTDALKEALLEILSCNNFDFDEFIESREKPVNITFVGINGTGKTTTIAKVAKRLLDAGHSVVIASADTYRAGAAEQIEEHASRLGVKVIKHQYGADPAAVVYDAVKYAKANHKEVVLADTAGRMHTSVNLMEQLKKICRVTKPDLVLFVDEAIAGNDAVERAKRFDELIGIDASILTKVDMDVKGGAAISIAYSTSKPIIFMGTGQGYDDLEKFDPAKFVERLIG